MRDFGPGFIVNSSSTFLLRPRYEGTHDGTSTLRDKDVQFIPSFAASRGLNVVDLSLSFEWGNWISSSAGLCITNTRVVSRNALRWMYEDQALHESYQVYVDRVEWKMRNVARTWMGCELVILQGLVNIFIELALMRRRKILGRLM